ncbi:MAG: ABC transporter ATP-binding protein, partial [Bryobacterales bacterium]|nr:ABC transporter ATP-binding protein [Bryobacterales bacterium]
MCVDVTPQYEAKQFALAAFHLKKTHRQTGWLARKRNFAVPALQDVSLSIERGRFMGLVGESGCGKSTLARCLACLDRPDEGQVWIDGSNLLTMNSRELRASRRKVQLIFQGSAAALNPMFSAAEIIAEPLAIMGRFTRQERREHALALMESVGLSRQLAVRKPSELSGGQRQRLAIARALALQPKLLILDESMVGLDLPVQAQIVNLLLALRKTLEISYLFISHDLRLAAYLSDDLTVMHDGRIVEQGLARDVVTDPQHAQTRA